MLRPFRFLGSLKVAVPTLVTIAGVLAWGTIYEARFGTAAVQRFVYGSWWFQGILSFLAVNLATAAFLRYPWKRKHIPFVLAHIGIILILTGGILGGRFGVQGQMIIPEGESSDSLQLDRNVLAVLQPNPGLTREFETRFETTAWDHAPHALFETDLEGGRLQLVVDRYFSNADPHEEISDAGERDNPAIHLTLSSEGHEDDIWLLARDRERFGARWGEAHVLFLELEDEKELKQMRSHTHPVLPPDSIVLIWLRSPDKLAVVTTGPKAVISGVVPVKVGRPFVHPSLGYRAKVSAFYPKARVEEFFTSRDDEVRSEAVRLTARSGERTVQSWLGLRESITLPFGKHPVIIEYRPAVRPVPFSVKLLDFRKTDYPGTEMAAAFESDVELSDPSRGVTFKKRISMNNPLKYRGYSLFQSSYVQGPKETTILSVRNDPGVPFVYTGFLIVLAGVITLFTSKSRMT